MDKSKLQEIKTRALNATPGPILEREDDDYYQGGTYLGTQPYYYVDGKVIDGIDPSGKGQCFKRNIFRVEEHGESDKEMFIHAREDILNLLAYIETLEKE